MPSGPSFDYYQALEVGKDADSEAITASYRRLARVHHPDKDRENPEATAKFQQIQEAYENLSDPQKRARHDARSSGRPANPYSSFYSSQHPFFSSDDEYEYGFYEDEDEDEYDYDDDIMEDFIRSHFFARGGPSFSRPQFTPYGSRETSEEEYRRYRQEMTEQERMDDKYRKMNGAAYQARVDELTARSEAKAKAKKAEEEKKHLSKEQREKAERLLQEKTWAELNATTLAKKQSSCLHSEFWAREQQTKKFKCGCCGQKRGPTGYKCPHCSLLSCQGCLATLNKKRTAA